MCLSMCASPVLFLQRPTPFASEVDHLKCTTITKNINEINIFLAVAITARIASHDPELETLLYLGKREKKKSETAINKGKKKVKKKKVP
mmetsp:Transcript_3922/g.7578  ORF Transcript_3922/g.7578 Transcript_3922/m.7578 type:complete len:89 (-) Transcript_3922:567-833(-)